MRTPEADAARQGFADAAARYAASLPADHVARADLQLMQASLDERGHRATAVDRAAALQAWQGVVKRPWPGHLVFLH